MDLISFSKQYPNEFLSRREENFNSLLDKIKLFHNQTKSDIGDGTVSRRKLDGRFNYEEELNEIQINQKGITSEEVAAEFNDMLSGCMRHQDPTTAFNLIPSPLLDAVAGATLMSLYTPNVCWDFLSGKLCLYEKKIIRMLGQLVNWPQADGYVISGGKQALIYAIKNGMGRASLTCAAETSDYVVLCSELAHYSIEHVCHYLGISPENCLRVATKPSGEINPEILQKTIDFVISQGKVIAAIIAVGGGTVNLVPDPIRLIREIIDSAVAKYLLNYIPYLHVDSVISWAWLAFEKATDSSWKNEISINVINKIEHVISKLSGIQYADSFAADFHKTGFCPYAAGVFIAKDSSNLSGMSINHAIPKMDILFGQAEIYRQTLENSRSGVPIASIWIALRRLGLDGLRQFVLYQLEVCEHFKQTLRVCHDDHFEVLNDHSNGWEIVIKPHFFSDLSWDQLQKASLDEQQAYVQSCHQFLSELWYKSLDDEVHQTPVIGFIKNYSRKGPHELSFPAYLIHPTSLHYDKETIHEMIEGIVRAKIAFERCYISNVTAQSSEEYLSQFTPPK